MWERHLAAKSLPELKAYLNSMFDVERWMLNVQFFKPLVVGQVASAASYLTAEMNQSALPGKTGGHFQPSSPYCLVMQRLKTW
jgi:hypothetical protein